jgi:hypothetical protein
MSQGQHETGMTATGHVGERQAEQRETQQGRHQGRRARDTKIPKAETIECIPRRQK